MLDEADIDSETEQASAYLRNMARINMTQVPTIGCIEGMGGKLELVAQFPNRPPVIIDHLAEEKAPARSATRARRPPRATRATV
jgi:hypothetical protein